LIGLQSLLIKSNTHQRSENPQAAAIAVSVAVRRLASIKSPLPQSLPTLYMIRARPYQVEVRRPRTNNGLCCPCRKLPLLLGRLSAWRIMQPGSSVPRATPQSLNIYGVFAGKQSTPTEWGHGNFRSCGSRLLQFKLLLFHTPGKRVVPRPNFLLL